MQGQRADSPEDVRSRLFFVDKLIEMGAQINGFNDEIYSNFSMAQASVDYIHRQVEPKVGGVSALNGSTGSADEFSKSTLEYAVLHSLWVWLKYFPVT